VGSLVAFVGVVLHVVAMIAAVFLYKMLKWGKFAHVVPYVFSVGGLLVLLVAPDFKNPILGSMIATAITAALHGVVIYDMRKNERSVQKM
jgi:hypothetical protein